MEKISQLAKTLASIKANVTIELRTPDSIDPINASLTPKDSTVVTDSLNNKITVHLKKAEVDLEFELYIDVSKVTILELKKKVNIFATFSLIYFLDNICNQKIDK